MALVKVVGQISSINHAARNLAVKDQNGEAHPIKWPVGMDAKMSKQKERWFVTATGEVVDGVMLLDTIDYLEKPAWAQQQGGKGGNFDPKKNTYIARQNTLERATEIVLNGENSNKADPKEEVEEILQIAEQLEKWVLR